MCWKETQTFYENKSAYLRHLLYKYRWMICYDTHDNVLVQYKGWNIQQIVSMTQTDLQRVGLGQSQRLPVQLVGDDVTSLTRPRSASLLHRRRAGALWVGTPAVLNLISREELSPGIESSAVRRLFTCRAFDDLTHKQNLLSTHLHTQHRDVNDYSLNQVSWSKGMKLGTAGHLLIQAIIQSCDSSSTKLILVTGS